MRYFEKGTTKVEIINEILDLKPSFNKNPGQLFSMTLEDLKIMLENLKKRRTK